MAKARVCDFKTFKEAQKRLYRAMTAADRKGYTGMVGSKGSLFDEPRVQAAKRNYDHILDRCKR